MKVSHHAVGRIFQRVGKCNPTKLAEDCINYGQVKKWKSQRGEFYIIFRNHIFVWELCDNEELLKTVLPNLDEIACKKRLKKTNNYIARERRLKNKTKK